MKRYLIGDTIFTWKEEGYALKQDLFMENFTLKATAGEAEHIFESRLDDMKAYAEGELLQKNGLFELYQLPEGKFIVYHWATCRFAFGFWVDDLKKDGPMTYYFNPDMKNQIPLDVVRFFSCAGIHSKLLKEEAIVMHASYVDWKGKAILFCGQSGAGKSTQASLWEEHEGAEIINGDRVLLKKKDGKWQAYGYPCCGSSAICKNETIPIHAIVMLEHGTDNTIEPVSVAGKMRAFIAGTERYLWDAGELDKVCVLAEQIIGEVPMFKFSCTPDRVAVETLKRKLEG